MSNYNHKKIESKWQKKWREEKLYQIEKNEKKKKFYVLDMFPYPSGAGLHIGHPKGYIATDIIARMKAMQGYNVLHPMGWDAFGLPAENYAIKNKIHPRAAVEENIKKFKEQLGRIGFTYDWEREINTTDPEYYRWTQWVFLKMFEKGLAYQSYESINWCPKCQTGLANEDLENGKCERCGSEVEKRPMRQWVLKMTAYADRLLEDLKFLDWDESIIEQQRNWIGKSGGAIVKFKAQSPKSKVQSPNSKFIEVFTTRPDTLFGCTYMVVAPEHKLLEDWKLEIKNWDEVEKYIAKSKKKSDLDRTDLAKEKTGVELKGIKAINPVNNEEIPIWAADYVLAGYGTGAIMAVPAHDERDFEFAKKYKINIKRVVVPKNELKSFFMQGSFDGDVKKELEENNFIYTVNNKGGFYVKLKLSDLGNYEKIVREHLKKEFWCEITGTKTIFIYGDGKTIKVNNEQDAIDALKKCKEFCEPMKVHYNLWEMLWNCEFYHDILCFTGDGININSGLIDKTKTPEQSVDTGNGVSVNSGFLNGLETKEAKQKIIKWLEENNFGGKAVNYKMRDWVFSRQRYWGEPIPIIHCEKCGAVAVPEDKLPVKLPEVKHYEPTGTGESPLANIKEWVNTTCPKCGGAAKRETNTMPQWAGSCWYYLRYLDPRNKRELVDKEKERYWMKPNGVDLYVGGAEHATRHLLYARFWHKFLYDIGVVSTIEPFRKLFYVGLILAEDGRKMSKRWGNVINPDEIVEKFGADSLRLYEMFMGPFSQATMWNTNGLVGMKRFLERVWDLNVKVQMSNAKSISNDKYQNSKIERLLHKTIKKVTEDIENFKFNTAVSQLMILVNELEKEKTLFAVHYSQFLILLSPFAPHIAEELWEKLGNKESIYLQSWPEYDPKLIKEEEVELVAQINGKLRDRIKVSADITEEEARKLVLESEKIKKWIEGKEIKKFIFVRGKLVNIVV